MTAKVIIIAVLAAALFISVISLLVVLGAAKLNKVPPFALEITPESEILTTGEPFIVNIRSNRHELLVLRAETDCGSELTIEGDRGSLGKLISLRKGSARIIVLPVQTMTVMRCSLTVEIADPESDEKVLRGFQFSVYPKDNIEPQSIDMPAMILLDEGEQKHITARYHPEDSYGLLKSVSAHDSVCSVYADSREVVFTAMSKGIAVIRTYPENNSGALALTTVIVRRKDFIDIECEFDEETGDLLELCAVNSSNEDYTWTMSLLMGYTVDGEFKLVDLTEDMPPFRSGRRTPIPSAAPAISALRCKLGLDSLGLWVTNIRCEPTRHLVVHNSYKRSPYWWKQIDVNTREACDSHCRKPSRAGHCRNNRPSLGSAGNRGRRDVMSESPLTRIKTEKDNI